MIHNTYRQTDYKDLWKQESTELARDVKNIWEQAKKKKPWQEESMFESHRTKQKKSFTAPTEAIDTQT